MKTSTVQAGKTGGLGRGKRRVFPWRMVGQAEPSGPGAGASAGDAAVVTFACGTSASGLGNGLGADLRPRAVMALAADGHPRAVALGLGKTGGRVRRERGAQAPGGAGWTPAPGGCSVSGEDLVQALRIEHALRQALELLAGGAGEAVACRTPGCEARDVDGEYAKVLRRARASDRNAQPAGARCPGRSSPVTSVSAAPVSPTVAAARSRPGCVPPAWLRTSLRRHA